MATKPSDPATTIPWATDTAFSSGPDTGLSTKSTPPAGYIAQGCVPSRSAPGRFMNFFFNQLYLWCLYLYDLHNSVDFLNKVYAWTGAHTFSTTVGVSGVLSTLRGVFQAASSSDIGVFVENAGQIRIDNATAGTPAGFYSGQLQLSPSQMGSDRGSYNPVTSSLALPTSCAGAAVCLNGLLPKNAYIQDVVMEVTKSSALSAELYLRRRNRSTGVVNNVGLHTISASGDQVFDTGLMGGAERQMVDPGTYTWEIQYIPSSSDADTIRNIVVYYRIVEIGKPS